MGFVLFTRAIYFSQKAIYGPRSTHIDICRQDGKALVAIGQDLTELSELKSVEDSHPFTRKVGCGSKPMGWCTGAPPILANLVGNWDVHWRYGILTHGQFWRKAPCE